MGPSVILTLIRLVRQRDGDELNRAAIEVQNHCTIFASIDWISAQWISSQVEEEEVIDGQI